MLLIVSLFSVVAALWPLWDTVRLLPELMEQARLQLTFFYVIILLFAFWRKKLFSSCIMLALIAFNIYWMQSSFSVVPKMPLPHNPTEKFRVFSFNVYKENKNIDEVAHAVLHADADIALLVELEKSALDALLPQLSQRYPFHFPQNDKDTLYEWAIFSKYPLQAENRTVKEGSGQKVMYAKIAYENRKIQLFGLHTLSPKSEMRTAVRNTQLSRLATHIAQNADFSEPIIVAGDMNTAPWQQCLRDFQKVAQLSNADNFWDMTLTWPTTLPTPFVVPIDHIFHNSQFCSSEKHRLANAGSDHYPIYADLYFCVNL